MRPPTQYPLKRLLLVPGLALVAVLSIAWQAGGSPLPLPGITASAQAQTSTAQPEAKKGKPAPTTTHSSHNASPVRKGFRIAGDAIYKPYDPIILKAEQLSSAAAQLLWDVDSPAQTIQVGQELHVWAPPGTYKVQLTAVDFDTKKIERTRSTFTVTGDTPTPPGPGPGPNPPIPPPGKGFHVLLTYDSAKKTSYPASQILVLQGKEVRDYLNAKCPTVAGKPDYGVWPSGGDPSDYPSAPLKTLYGKITQPAPALVVGDDNGNVIYQGPLPTTVADALATLKKYGGN